MKSRYLTFFFALLCLAPFARGQSGSTVAIGASNDTRPVGATSIWYYQAGTTGDVPAWPGWHQFTGGSGGSSGTAGASGTTVTPTITSATTGGTVAAGSRSVTFIFSANFTGTVLGVAYAGATDASQPFVAPAGCTLSSITYTVTAGSVRIVDIR